MTTLRFIELEAKGKLFQTTPTPAGYDFFTLDVESPKKTQVLSPPRSDLPFDQSVTQFN